MNIANLSIKRPIFITCIATLIIVIGWLSLKKLPVDLFPNVTFPIVTVTTPYPGAGPSEVETLVSKVYEEEFSNVPGVKKISSQNLEGISIIIAEFNFDTDIKYAEQQIRDRVSSAKKKLPAEILEPTIRRIDPADQPIITIAVKSNIEEGELFKIIDKKIKPKFEQVNQVGLIEILGGRKREIKVELDRNKLKSHEISASQVTERLKISGLNIPAGKVSNASHDTVYRTMGEFQSLDEIKKTIVNFIGNDVPITVGDVAKVQDSLKDRKSYGYFNGNQAVLLNVFKQSGSNTMAVADALKKKIESVNDFLKNDKIAIELKIVRDGSKMIKANVDDVYETIIIGIILTIVVVFFFLGSARSTFITGLALPNSLIGSFIFLSLFGFSINLMTLLALSLAVGLLIDDAIVVRENIFRHIEMGEKPIDAAIKGTNEVALAVIATTLAVIAVFGPIAFLSGVVGQFFRQFGLTVCFALIISLFDALTMAPMLSAYFAGKIHHQKTENEDSVEMLYEGSIGKVIKLFNQFQDWLEDVYVNVLKFTLKKPKTILSLAVVIFLASFIALKNVPKTFIPAQDQGEFLISFELPPGASLEGMNKLALEIDHKMRANKEIEFTVLTVGDRNEQSNKADIYVRLVPSKKRKLNTSGVKEIIRDQLKIYAHAIPQVKDIDAVGAGQRPFAVNIVGEDMREIEKYSKMLFEKIKNHPALKDVDLNYRPGKPEFQVVPDRVKAERLGISTTLMGAELRNLIEGTTPAVFRQDGEEYDIRVRLQENQRNLREGYHSTYIPNINYTLVKLDKITAPNETTGPANITRQDRGRYIDITADIAPKGPGLGGAIQDINKIMKDEIKLPPNMKYQFIGQAENFGELVSSMMMAAFLGTLFIYFVLASLYESFITPFTIMLVLPLAACGAFYALAITGSSLDLFSMIGCIMLLGVATKNSILLVDYTNQLTAGGMELSEAILASGKARLRPILMTSFALIAGMIPLAIGLNEASRQRTSMGVAVIGGLISSTILTLVVVPAAYTYIEKFRNWSLKLMKRIFT